MVSFIVSATTEGYVKTVPVSAPNGVHAATTNSPSRVSVGRSGLVNEERVIRRPWAVVCDMERDLARTGITTLYKGASGSDNFTAADTVIPAQTSAATATN
jgi:hypothetical protein